MGYALLALVVAARYRESTRGSIFGPGGGTFGEGGVAHVAHKRRLAAFDVAVLVTALAVVR